jgi:hypothetical protein
MRSFEREGPALFLTREDWLRDHAYSARFQSRYSARRFFVETGLYCCVAAVASVTLPRFIDSSESAVQVVSQCLRFIAYFFAVLNGFSIIAIAGRLAKDAWAVGASSQVYVYRMPSIAKPADKSKMVQGSAETHPPKLAAFLLQILLPARDRNNIIGDLEEAFNSQFVPTFGAKKAAFVYWARAIREIGWVLMRTLRNIWPYGLPLILALMPYLPHGIQAVLRALFQSDSH